LTFQEFVYPECFMKRIVLWGFLALFITGFVSAQMGPRGVGPGGMGRRTPQSPQIPQVPQVSAAEQVTLSGELSIVHGRIALASGDTTYYVSGLSRFIGFIEGLKEGARVNLEGSAYQFPGDATVKFLRVSKLTLNGKDYDLSARPEAFASPDLPPSQYNYRHPRWR
jgi:hypothetical protein